MGTVAQAYQDGGLLFAGVITTLWGVLVALPLWHALKRIGYSGWWSLISITGLGLVVLLYMLGFGRTGSVVAEAADSFESWN